MMSRVSSSFGEEKLEKQMRHRQPSIASQCQAASGGEGGDLTIVLLWYAFLRGC